MLGENYDAHVEKEWAKKAVVLNVVILTDFKTQNIQYILELIICKCLLVIIGLLLFQSPVSL